MIQERLRAGLTRVRDEGKRLGWPPIALTLEKRTMRRWRHWLAAEREIMAAAPTALASKPAPKKKRPSPARSKAAERSRWPANAAHHTRDASACSAAIRTLSGCHGLAM